MMAQGFIYGALCILAGGFMLFGGITNFGNTEVMCGSSPMKPGQICTESKEGTDRELTYEQVKDDNESTSTWLTVGGAAMLLVGVVWFGSSVVAVRKLSRARKAPVPTYPQQQPRQFPHQR